MHDLDRIQMETELEGQSLEGMEYGHEMEGEYGEQEFEQFLGDPELESDHFLGDIVGGIFGGELEAPLNEAQEVDLATELLGVGNEMELEQFLGNLFKSAVRGVSNFAKSSAGRALGGVLKNVAKKALPIAGRVLGATVGGPIGSTLGGKLGDAASNMFEVEFEGLSQEDHEFEVAKKFVRFGATAAKQAAQHAVAGALPKQAVRQAVVTAARAHAPGMLRQRGPCTHPACQGRAPHAAHPLQAGHHPHARHPGQAVHPGQHPHARHPGHLHPGHPQHAQGHHQHRHPTHGGHPGYANGQTVHAANGIAPHAANGAGGPAARAANGAVAPGYAGPGYAGSDDYVPTDDYAIGRTGRWVRRGRHIVLLGLAS